MMDNEVGITFAAMVKHLLSGLLVTALLGGQWLHTLVLADFAVHQDIIATTLCIKKEEMQNTCKGKCHLKKQLKAAEENTADLPKLPKETFNITLFHAPVPTMSFNSEEGQAYNPRLQQLNPLRVRTELFRPPRMV